MATQTTIKLALDWTPNTIHTGLFCAIEKGYYAASALEVQLLAPDADYTITPVKRLQNGEVDLAVCPSESVIAYNETARMKLQAIYAILQRDASAIVSTKHDSIALLGKGVYGSYNAKYEDHIVRAMIDAAGGDGSGVTIERSTGKFSLFEEVQKGAIDGTWVFMPWEGVKAEMEGVKLHAFIPGEYGVPYGYSPVIARNADSSSLDADALRRFVKATVEGYAFAKDNPLEAARILAPHCQPVESEEFLGQSQARINQFLLEDDSSGAGRLKTERWDAWTGWLRQRQVLQGEVSAADLFTNEFFD